MKSQQGKSLLARAWGGNEPGSFKEQQEGGMRLEQSEVSQEEVGGGQQGSGHMGPPGRCGFGREGNGEPQEALEQRVTSDPCEHLYLWLSPHPSLSA